MTHPSTAETGLFVRCLDVLERLDAEEQWGMSAAERRELAATVMRLVAPAATPGQIRTVLINYRHSGAQVRALLESCGAEHTAAWAGWMTQARPILRHARCDWAQDVTVDFDDLAQIAMLELSRSLPSYRFASRFSTWAYQVIVRGVQRHLRDLAAQKRSGDIAHGVDPRDLPVATTPTDAPEEQALGRSLAALVREELERAFGARNAEVFQLSACEDLSVEVISRRVGLSTARVHAILAQSRRHLREHEDLRRWYEPPTD